MKQDVTVELFYDGQWNEAPLYSGAASHGSNIRISRGKPDETSEPTPASLSLTLDNRAAVYNPKQASSPLYGMAGRNTPIRVVLDGNTRFTGEVAEWKPQRTEDFNPATGTKGDAWTEIVANGVLRRLGQGNSARSPLRRAIEREANLITYWPMEDGEDTGLAINGVNDGPPLIISQGVVNFESDGPAGSAGYAEIIESPSTVLSAKIPAYTHTGDEWSFSFWAKGVGNGALGAYDETILVAITTKNGFTYRLGLANAWYGSPISAFVTIYDTSDSLVSWRFEDGVITYPGRLDGEWHLLEIEVANNGGGNAAVFFYVDGEGYGGVLAGGAYSRPATISVPLVHGPVEADELGVSHLAFFKDEFRASVDLWEVGRGYIGESAADRVERLCDEVDIGFTLVGSANDCQAMGIQPPKAITEILAEVELTDSGQLFDMRDSRGLMYRTGRSIYSQDAALALDFSAGYIVKPLDPVLDDQRTRNDVTAKRYRGSSYRVVQETGPNNVQDPTDDPDGVGRVETTVDVNPESDDDLRNHAYWHLHFGTNNEIRYPRVTIEVDNAPALLADINAVEIGDLITISNFPDDISHDMARLIVLGYDEVIESHRRQITFNCMPASPFDIGEWDQSAGTTSTRWGTAGTIRPGVTPISSSQTSITFDTPSGPLWTENDAHFPLDIMVGGERMTVTDIAPDTGTRQIFTVTRSVNGVVKGHPAGVSVEPYQPALYGL